MKTTIDISDALAERARRRSRDTGQSLRAMVEEGLRLVLDRTDAIPAYELPDRRVGRPGGDDPLEALSWAELRDTIYGGR